MDQQQCYNYEARKAMTMYRPKGSQQSNKKTKVPNASIIDLQDLVQDLERKILQDLNISCKTAFTGSLSEYQVFQLKQETQLYRKIEDIDPANYVRLREKGLAATKVATQ